MSANAGSTTFRNVPDVALTADSVYVTYNNGNSGGFAGTSCAAPLWAGFCALVNQQSVAAGGTTVGFLNPALYAIANSSNYANCFHDVTTGNNIGANTPGLFNAVAGYDLCTGLGTPNGTNLINALTPYLAPHFLTQPVGQTVTNGSSVVLSATVGGRSPLNYRWLFNGANLPNGGNISGATSNVLSILAAAPNNSGNYQIIASNNYGSVTSSVAVLTVGSAPAFSAQPTNLTILSGGNAVLSATVSGSTPLIYQWRKNGTNLVNGGSISGVTSNNLTLASVTTNSSGNYQLFVTNDFGVSTSGVATLSVVLPAAIVSSPANQSIECGSNVTFNASAAGTAPLKFQWSLDGTPISGATNSSVSLSNVHLPTHTVTHVEWEQSARDRIGGYVRRSRRNGERQLRGFGFSRSQRRGEHQRRRNEHADLYGQRRQRQQQHRHARGDCARHHGAIHSVGLYQHDSGRRRELQRADAGCYRNEFYCRYGPIGSADDFAKSNQQCAVAVGNQPGGHHSHGWFWQCSLFDERRYRAG
jgi:hypothetical protein